MTLRRVFSKAMFARSFEEEKVRCIVIGYDDSGNYLARALICWVSLTRRSNPSDVVIVSANRQIKDPQAGKRIPGDREARGEVDR